MATWTQTLEAIQYNELSSVIRKLYRFSIYSVGINPPKFFKFWGPFTIDMTRRVMLGEDGTFFLEDDGPTNYDDQAFAMCRDCQQQAPVSSFRQAEG